MTKHFPRYYHIEKSQCWNGFCKERSKMQKTEKLCLQWNDYKENVNWLLWCHPGCCGELRLGGISGEIKEEIGRVDNNSDQLTKKQRRKKLRNHANQTFSSPSGEDHPEKIAAVANTAVSVELENLDEQFVNKFPTLTNFWSKTCRILVIFKHKLNKFSKPSLH